jgi:hypothetical protein
MTIVTLEEDVARSAEHLESLLRRVAEYRRHVERAIERTEEGLDVDETAVSNALSKIQAVALSCNKAEKTLHECRREQAGIAQGSYALDLGKARADIGCKLDRLRRCGDADPVSG